ncbi:MAG TPA: NUDIX domain-containing protein [Candidatus Paceibacterota bacterium]|nr:NUDIX domain-containing protein [Candidatus Paceibacterota bacterium]
MAEKFKMYVSANLHLVRDGGILLLRRHNTGWKDGLYGVVAGHVDGNETIADAMVREAKEEADIDLVATDLRVVHAQHRITADREYIDFHLIPAHWEGEPTNLEPEKCDDLSWHPINQLPENIIPYMRIAFDCIQNNIFYSEYREPGT